jgi:D-alanyl-D-alanine-carboxypeptidase/D-alanyl-D-alanine-endopeptidase
MTDVEIRKLLAHRIDVERQGVGIVVGMTEPGGRRVIAYGLADRQHARPVDGDSVFEIGSVTKVFTSLLLALAVQRGEMALDDPIAKYLPPAVATPSRGGRSITLLDLSQHTSALPRLPANLHPSDINNPYAHYTVEQLYECLSGVSPSRDIGSVVEYSNLGGGLLGHLLARHAAKDYETLIHEEIAAPLGMRHTAIRVTPEMSSRFARGHDMSLEPTPNWDLPTLAGAGALRSTANDLLIFLDAFLDHAPNALAPAMAAMLMHRRPAGLPHLEIGLGWSVLVEHSREIVWHNGGTGGYRSFVGFDPQRQVGVVVLGNAATTVGVDDIGLHLLDPEARLTAMRVPSASEARDNERFAGRYQLTTELVLTVTNLAGRLFVRMTGQQRLELTPQGRNVFGVLSVGARLQFETGASGPAGAVVLTQRGRNQRAPRIVE